MKTKTSILLERFKVTDTVNIMGIDFLNTDKQTFIDDITARAGAGKKSFIVTANPEIVMLAKENSEYREAVMQADYTIPDGAGVVIASRLQKQPLQERVAGFEVMTELIGRADGNNLSCYFLGASKEVNQRMVAKLKELHPELNVAGHHHGFFDLDDRQVVDDVIQAKADFIFVALGVPRQELWITKYLSEFEKGTFIGVGGSFDIIAGEVKRAPEIWIKLNLEWLYRLLKQPFRWKRILKVFEFIFRILFKRY
ncbi:WecB/TagA/CpsF family glycosyltransferase [Gracilibacillus alcaliphilus]|uniref:WecB/TagA/CpsF family glycosyltransferase n=1 Tax=Gracilibacillus alcaliphilus TaxID=1401441 RepID=UPI00195C5FE7|nr:WecB/TagA/CpsF family glycosyltransferase [Gracilibacillus alcaliphilus]MBM7678427.1 N-acetylglucosaminyldiphosphoundecaprenol N-acetyl-beta-D-mannosaminyltransferase [Gracilibacillus alcaliphilus]